MEHSHNALSGCEDEHKSLLRTPHCQPSAIQRRSEQHRLLLLDLNNLEKIVQPTPSVFALASKLNVVVDRTWLVSPRLSIDLPVAHCAVRSASILTRRAAYLP